MNDAAPTSDSLAHQRIITFIGAMLPIAIGFDLIYGIAAALLHSAAIAGGAFAVLTYVLALLLARSWAQAGRTAAAAELVGYALLVMVVLGSLSVRFLFAALVMMPLAGVAVVLPFLSGRRLRLYLAAAVFTEAVVVVFDSVLPALFEQPPTWFSIPVTGVAVVAAAALTVRLLWIDSQRLHLALERQRHAVQLRDDFLAVAGHELRTPLTALMVHLGRPELGDQLRTRALRQANRLGTLVEDLLDASRISSGRLELHREETELDAIARRAAEETAEQFERARCELQISTDAAGLRGEWDPKRLTQVATNLLSNAAKYGAGKPVELRTGGDATSAWLSVRDHGIGLQPEERERIFERYERAVSSTRYGGLGLGLWIAREIVEAHGGTISVESTPGSGSLFRVTLPRSAAPQRGGAPSTTTPPR